MDIVIASANKHKIEEFQKIFANSFQNIVSMTDAGFSGDVEETGETLFENALIKAKTVSEALGVPVLSDDTGLIAVALKNEPGVRSARYAGDHDDAKNRKKLIEKLENLDKTAYFSCVLVLYYPDGHYITAEGKTYGTIVSEERGNGGFGYDSIFLSEDLGKTFAEATPEEKNGVSHRGRAAKNLLDALEQSL